MPCNASDFRFESFEYLSSSIGNGVTSYDLIDRFLKNCIVFDRGYLKDGLIESGKVETKKKKEKK